MNMRVDEAGDDPLAGDVNGFGRRRRPVTRRYERYPAVMHAERRGDASGGRINLAADEQGIDCWCHAVLRAVHPTWTGLLNVM
jgi:hypothetical protein